jgi:hypothetical protein
MFEKSNIEKNLQMVRELKADNPAMTHIYLRRPDGVAVDIPLAQIEFTIRQRPEWIVAGLPAKVVFPKPVEELFEVPAKPSETKITDEMASEAMKTKPADSKEEIITENPSPKRKKPIRSKKA